MISRNMGLVKSGVRTLNFGRAYFRLFEESLDEITWEALLRDKGIEASSLLFKMSFREHKNCPRKEGRRLVQPGEEKTVRPPSSLTVFKKGL